MATIEVIDDDLLVNVEGVDKLWSLKSRLSIPSPTWWAQTAKPTGPGSGFTAFASGARTCRG